MIFLPMIVWESSVFLFVIASRYPCVRSGRDLCYNERKFFMFILCVERSSYEIREVV